VRADPRRLGVLLMTYGSPADLDDMARYLTAVRGGREPAPELVEEFRRRYRMIGGSPLIDITKRQAAAVEDALKVGGIDARVRAGMRFSQPSIGSGLADLVEAGCEAVVGIIMSPQFSELLMSGYRRALIEACDALDTDPPRVQLAPAWFEEPQFLAAVASRIREGLARLPIAEQDRAPVLLTAHSLPRRIAEAEPQYLDQLRRTATLVADRAGLTQDRWHFCWQSAGHEPGEWMKPDFADLVPQLRDAGHRSVLVAPIQFLADHLEILYDIDIGARQQASEASMSFARIDSLNVHPQFIAALSRIAVGAARTEPAIDDAAPAMTSGRR